MATTPTHPVFAPQNLAVITGGASGIGLALATKCAQVHQMRVLLVDVNASNLASAKEFIKGDVDTFEGDVSKLEDFERLKGKIEKDYGGKISLLALNAAIGAQGTWGNASYFSSVININLFGVLNGLNTLLPLVTSHSTSSSPSSIIITGSKQGITNPPGNAAYNASKSAVKTIAEHLSFELSTSSPSTSVHLLIPGWTFTGLSGNHPFAQSQGGQEVKKEKPQGAWSAEQVVEFLEVKMTEGQFYVLCPDGDVSEELDRKRILWGVGDLVEGRPPLTRWRGDWKEKAAEGVARIEVKR